ncbi:hypothetical protein [Oscillatoria sp. FACHB-1407]|nr:hypothetical protein [Oscillatoria sp. FACHB-1407]
MFKISERFSSSYTLADGSHPTGKRLPPCWQQFRPVETTTSA